MALFASKEKLQTLEEEILRLTNQLRAEREESLLAFQRVNTELAAEVGKVAALQEALLSAGVSKAQIDAVNAALSDNAKATAEAGRLISSALTSLALATERGARAKQREVETNIAKAP